MEAEVFIPAAASRLITKQHLEEMIASKLEVISAGANVPFADKEIFFGPIADFADSRVAVIPDFIANCGMARVFAYLMTTDAEITDEAIFEDTSKTIERALRKTFEASNSDVNISKTSFEIALSQLI